MSGPVNRASQWGPKVKKIVLATVLLAAGSASAYAADLPARTYTKASVVEVAYNWSGFYLGANAGYGFSHRAVNYGSSNEVGEGLISLGGDHYGLFTTATYCLKSARCRRWRADWLQLAIR